MKKRSLFYFLMGAGLCMGITAAKQPVMATEAVTTTASENTTGSADTETLETVIKTAPDDAADDAGDTVTADEAGAATADDASAEDTADEADADDTEEADTANEADAGDTEEADTADDADALADALYSGIQIDGDFSDWTAVDKVYNFNTNLTEASVIWDHDYVYLYLQEGVKHPDGYELYEGNIHAATPYSNGNFCIETNTGYKSSVQIQGLSNGSVTVKVNGTSVEAAYAAHKYEIAVPVSLLKGYNDKTSSLNFGTMGSIDDTPNYVVTGITHWNPDVDPDGDGGTQDKGDGDSDIYDKTTYIKYDYDFSDWDDYPHHTIDYSTGGAHGADAEGALYSDGDYVYGHIKYYGGYYSDIYGFFELAVNEQYDSILQLSAKAVDNEGNILWGYDTSNLSTGSYEFHVFGPETVDGGAWTTDYGVLYIEVQESGRVNAEFRLSQSSIAHFYKCDQTDIKSIDMRFIRIGTKWISCAGTSTAPVLGMAISGIAVLGSMWVYNRRKKRGTAA